MHRATTQRLVTLAMAVLDDAAYASATRKVSTPEVRLALAFLWTVLRDRSWLDRYWHKANHVSGLPWEGCRDAWYGIAASLRAEGWYAPIEAEWLSVTEALDLVPPVE